MTGTTRLLLTLTALTGFGLQGQDLSTVSGANCTFKRDPAKFQGQTERSIKAITSQLAALDKSRKTMKVSDLSVLDPSTVQHANFIDDQIFPALSAAGVQAAPISSDEEFFRRINLDLTGRIPAAADVLAFEADTTPNKRANLIETLLASSAFTDKWTMWLGDLLQNNVTAVAINRNVNGRNAFYQYIYNAMQAGESFKEMAYEIVTATGNNYDGPSAAGFIVNGFAPGGPGQDTYDMSLVKTAQTFLGLDHYDCLLCHDGRGHLDALSLWGSKTTRTQAEQMAAFFARVTRPGFAFPTGTSTTDQQTNYYYQSVIIGDNTTAAYSLPTNYGNRPNRPMLGTVNSVSPVYRTGETPGSGAWRAQFATLMVNDPMFSVNFANRIWKAMFNLGQVDTEDKLDPMRLDPNNPPAAPWTLQAFNPVLLSQLADTFVRSNYDLRGMLRFIANSSAYQLSSEYPGGTWDPSTAGLFARHYPRRMWGEEVHDAIAQSTGVFAKYTPRGFSSPVLWAMQMPDTSEPASNTNNANNFMNYFLRGNRDNVPRSSFPTILQSGALMNDSFMNTKFHMSQSPNLQAVAKLTTPAAQVQQLYLTFLSRLPTAAESTAAVAYLTAPTTAAAKNAALEDLAWSLINKLEFVFSY
jgi:hypothetical protein